MATILLLIASDWPDQGFLLQHPVEAEPAELDIERDLKVPGTGPLQKPAVRFEYLLCSPLKRIIRSCIDPPSLQIADLDPECPCVARSSFVSSHPA